MMREVGGELGVGGVQKPREGVYFKKPGTSKRLPSGDDPAELGIIWVW